LLGDWLKLTVTCLSLTDEQAEHGDCSPGLEPHLSQPSLEVLCPLAQFIQPSLI